jgi:hypothetical protein
MPHSLYKIANTLSKFIYPSLLIQRPLMSYSVTAYESTTTPYGLIHIQYDYLQMCYV